jgi:hypothetical protein
MVIRGYKIVYGRLINIPDDMDYDSWKLITKLICSNEDYNNLEYRCIEVSGEEIKKELVIQLLYGEIYQGKLQQLIHTSHNDQHLHVEGKVCYEINENIDPKLWSRIVWRWEKGSPMTLKDLILTTKNKPPIQSVNYTRPSILSDILDKYTIGITDYYVVPTGY